MKPAAELSGPCLHYLRQLAEGPKMVSELSPRSVGFLKRAGFTRLIRAHGRRLYVITPEGRDLLRGLQ